MNFVNMIKMLLLALLVLLCLALIVACQPPAAPNGDARQAQGSASPPAAPALIDAVQVVGTCQATLSATISLAGIRVPVQARVDTQASAAGTRGLAELSAMGQVARCTLDPAASPAVVCDRGPLPLPVPER